ncbi:MAG: phosphoribosylformylglycinamidine synthase subunit PurQ [Candidatus Brockarchaeota archaeon]|nr:phosphoribosylformylglycinamidine synthase subunit PurQ [Candidatus Brockarchaeota archaeon]
MSANRFKALVLRTGGTNCDLETKVALEDLGVKTEIVHMNNVEKKSLLEYHLIVFPGGFSYGDYVRAGAVWGKRVLAKLRLELERFIEEGRLILGICNGFQVLAEAGILPGNGVSETPSIALANNSSAKYECRWVWLRVENNETPFTMTMRRGEVLRIPVGHAEGRFLTRSEEDLEELKKNRQIVFRYVLPNGDDANGLYPFNPNGSTYDIAGICSRKRNVMGMMPHPERAFFGWQLPEWGRRPPERGAGWKIFKSIVDYLESYR